MKKLLLTLIVSLALCGSTFAQPYETHWPGFNNYIYEMQGGLVAAIIIDGEPITVDYEGWDALEIAAFVGEDVCRAVNIYLNDEFVVEFDDPYPVTWGNAIFYTTPGEELYFKMYDHSRDIEYTFVTALQYGEPLTLLTGDDHFEGWDNPEDVISLSFVSPTEYYWNVTEGEWTEPAAGANVTIPDNSIVIIPDGVIADAGEITLGANSQIIIEDGGQLYHTNEVEVTMEMNVDGYNNTGTKGGAGYRLIASPVYTDATDHSIPVSGTNLDDGTYDLYKFVEAGDAEGREWFNFKETANNFTKLFRTEGYLYASASTNNNIAFAGMTTPTNYAVAVPVLQYTDGKRFAGWNLLGNPYTCDAYVTYNDAALSYYKMNANGSELEAVENGAAIAPMKGIFVQATTDIQSCLFTTTAPSSSKGSLNITVNQGRDKMDNAILSFGNGSTLKKFQLNPNHTKVYMTQDGEDYAVASASEMGEMPVSFKAENNGTYTLSFTSQEVSFNYLHLIDNMTGADVDLLANPSYSFNALTTDYASRFKLVFATGNNSDDSFAFMSNGSLIVSNEGNATLQVIDINGRILSSESINGSASISVNGAAGVYMIRLVNGDNARVQKVVVK